MRPVPAHPASTSTPGHNPETADVRLGGATPLVTDLSLDDLERDARHAIGEMAYAYYSGGADDERLLEGNVAAWSHWQLHPRVLAGIAEVSTATTLLGTPVSSPVAVAPTAIQGLAHPEGEAATARGAAEVGALMILSSLATCPLEDVAAAAPGAARWMQVYILRERARTAELVSRAAAHGYRRPGPDRRRPGVGTPAAASGGWACTCPTTSHCPTWRATAPRAPTRVASWRWSPTSSSLRSGRTTSSGWPG